MDHGNCPIKRCHITRDRDTSASYWEIQGKITPGGNDPYVFRVYPPVTSGLILLSRLGRAQCRNRYPVNDAVTVLLPDPEIGILSVDFSPHGGRRGIAR